MTHKSTSTDASVNQDSVPSQRRSGERWALEAAMRGLAAMREATERLNAAVGALGEREVVQPSLLPGWTRAHVVTHLARNADALVNLLIWARTGVEHPMYASRADRDADIEEGSKRLAQVLREDLEAACARLDVAAAGLSGSDWQAEVAHRTGRVFPAWEIPTMRLFEAWVHLVDLDVGVGFHDVLGDHVERLLERAVLPHAERTEGRRMRVRVELPGGTQRTWDLASDTSASSPEVSGSAADVLAWLTGRGDGSALTGGAVALPAWG